MFKCYVKYVAFAGYYINETKPNRKTFSQNMHTTDFWHFDAHPLEIQMVLETSKDAKYSRVGNCKNKNNNFLFFVQSHVAPNYT